MHVLSKRPLRAFWSEHPDAEGPLRAWHQAAQRDDWRNFAEVRARCPQADRVGRFTVFNLGGNKYRLITVIHCNRGKGFVRNVLTHKEYDLGKWKDD
jgi:mRNA interferase HigB